MGQARQRGTFEERKASAIKRNEARRQRWERERQERYRNMSPAERVRRARAALFLNYFDYYIPPHIRRLIK